MRAALATRHHATARLSLFHCRFLGFLPSICELAVSAERGIARSLHFAAWGLLISASLPRMSCLPRSLRISVRCLWGFGRFFTYHHHHRWFHYYAYYLLFLLLFDVYTRDIIYHIFRQMRPFSTALPLRSAFSHGDGGVAYCPRISILLGTLMVSNVVASLQPESIGVSPASTTPSRMMPSASLDDIAYQHAVTRFTPLAIYTFSIDAYFSPTRFHARCGSHSATMLLMIFH